MSVRKRKKAIQKVVKLLNLSTSPNTSESTMALRHAELLIRQYEIAQRELPILQLCDRSALYRVSWGGAAPKYQKEIVVRPSTDGSIYNRRFSEKNNDPNRAYESVRTFIDDIDLNSLHDLGVSSKKSEGTNVANCCMGDNSSVLSADTSDFNFQGESAQEYLKVDVDLVDGSKMAAGNVLNEPGSIKGSVKSEIEQDNMSAYTAPNDNVINATKAFRPDSHEFRDTIKTQYVTSDPNVSFSEDSYWSKVYEKLADFDETKMQTVIDALDKQLSLAKESVQVKKKKRYEHEQSEVQERTERAHIEQSFEEAIEKAFQSRAKSYEAWEDRCMKIRMACLRDEQGAVQGFDSISHELVKSKETYKQHLQQKKDYRAAKIMHELRRHLMLAVSVGEDAATSYVKVIEIMAGNGLSLKDLEFSDIKNKSLFIRLLERESAQIAEVDEREKYTEKMLDKFLAFSLSKKESPMPENPIQYIQRLLIAANEGGQFETQKNLEQVIYLMDSNDISVRNIGYGFIKKYSVFIRLINWEAERIASLSEREKFTAQILEEYIQHSVKKPKLDRELRAN